MPRPGRPRILTGIHESKTLALYNAGRALLSGRDYEAFSVAELAKDARCSVGAFYVRFPDKNAFLGFVISESFSFAAQSLATALVKGDIKAIGNAAKARLAVSVLLDQFTDHMLAGVVRAAIKLDFADPNHRTTLDAFRNTMTDMLTESLAEDRSKHETQIRAALQIIFGAMIDAILKESGRGIARNGSLQSASVFLLESAVSGSLKTSGRMDDKKLIEKVRQNPQPVSSLKKPAKVLASKPSPNAAPKPAPVKPSPASRSRRIRKI